MPLFSRIRAQRMVLTAPDKRAQALSHDENGSIIMLCVFTLLVLLLVVGLAIDGGQLYRHHIWMQKAADSAAMAGIGYSILDVDAGAAVVPADVEARAIAVANDNLRVFGIHTGGNINIAAAWDPTDQSITVTISRDVDLLVMDLVPAELFWGGRGVSDVNVTVDAISRRKEAVVALVTDFSNSMICPNDVGADPATYCECMQTNDCHTDAATANVQKIDYLEEAVNEFVLGFRDDYDSINFIPFNIAAKEEISVALVTAATRTDITAALNAAALNNTTTASNTNISDGLMRAWEDMDDAGHDNATEVSYVLFTDGAPTAGRFLFGSIAVGGLTPNNGRGGAAGGIYDYIHYTVDWYDSTTAAALCDDTSNYTAGNPYAGPSRLVKTERLTSAVPNRLRFGWLGEDDGSIINAALAPNSQVPACSGSGIAPYDTTTFDSVFNSCLADMSFKMPEGTTLYADNYGGAGSAKPWETFWREQYYNSAVQMSDFLRERRGMVFTIGLGPEDGDRTSIYQDVCDTFARKDFFLARTANDYVLAHDLGYYSSVAESNVPFPDVSFTNCSTYATWQAELDKRRGRYFASSDATDLVEMFKAVRVQILLSLVS